MRCDEARAAWTANRYSQAPSPEVAAHLASCADCAAFVHEQTALDALLAVEVNDPPGPGFDTRFFARLGELKAAPGGGLWARLRWAGLGGAFLAAVAMAALVVVPRLHDATTPEDMAIAMNLDLLQEDVSMLQQLQDVEAYELLSRLPANARGLQVPE